MSKRRQKLTNQQKEAIITYSGDRGVHIPTKSDDDEKSYLDFYLL